MADSKLIWSPSTPSDEESFFRAELGTTLPTLATFMDELPADWKGHGWCGEDGFRNNISRDVTKHRAFSGRHVHTTQDSYEETIQVTFLENSPIVYQTVFGTDNVEVSMSGGHRQMVVRHSDEQLPRQSFVIRVVEGEKTKVYVIPEGQVVEIDEVSIVHDEMLMYTVTIDCFKPESGSQPDNPEGVNEYIDEPDVDEPGT
jgi:hypothetical protein